MSATPDPETTLAAGALDDVDAHVLDQLRHLHEVVDPPPADLVDRVKFAMTVAALEAEVADIVSSATLETVRGTDYDRADTVTFASDGLSVMVSIEHGATTRADIVGLGERDRRRGRAPRARTHPHCGGRRGGALLVHRGRARSRELRHPPPRGRGGAAHHHAGDRAVGELHRASTRRAEALLAEARHDNEVGRFVAAADRLGRALEALGQETGEDAERLRVRVLITRSWTELEVNGLGPALRMLHDARARATAIDDRLLVALSHVQEGAIHVRGGQLGRHPRRAGAGARRRGRAQPEPAVRTPHQPGFGAPQPGTQLRGRERPLPSGRNRRRQRTRRPGVQGPAQPRLPRVRRRRPAPRSGAHASGGPHGCRRGAGPCTTRPCRGAAGGRARGPGTICPRRCPRGGPTRRASAGGGRDQRPSCPVRPPCGRPDGRQAPHRRAPWRPTAPGRWRTCCRTRP